MLSRSSARVLMIVAVGALCGPAIFRGADIVRFSIADTQNESVRRWVDVSGLAFSARESSMIYVDDRKDQTKIFKRRNEQIDILSVRPMSSEYWLWLSDMRSITGAPASKVAEALAFSVLTGPN